MKKGRLGLLLIIVIGFLLFSIHTQAEAENWKHFFKDKNGGIWYYDKDSIHYPYNTKGLLGSIKPDRSIVRVWIKRNEEWICLEEIWCSKREINAIQNQELKTATSKNKTTESSKRMNQEEIKKFADELKASLDESTGMLRIIPGSIDDKLYNEVCK